jgi:hypothetical protein
MSVRNTFLVLIAALAASCTSAPAPRPSASYEEYSKRISDSYKQANVAWVNSGTLSWQRWSPLLSA